MPAPKKACWADSFGRGHEKDKKARPCVAASPGSEVGYASLRSSQGGLPKRQSPTQRRPITASVGYSPSQNPSAACPVVFSEATVRLLLFISLLRQLRNKRHSCGRVSAGVSIPVRSDFNTRGCGQTRRPWRTPAPDRIVGNRLLAGQAPVVSPPELAAVPASLRKRLPVRWRESRALL